MQAGWIRSLVWFSAAIFACGGGDISSAPPAGGEADSWATWVSDGGADVPDEVEVTPPEPALRIVCPPGVAGCVGDDLLACNEAGTAFELGPCAVGLVCHEGDCVECGSDEDCVDVAVCTDAQVCELLPLEILTGELPPCLTAVPYDEALEAQGGVPPYSWDKTQGTLPPGIQLLSDGGLTGLTTQEGTYPFKVKVTDASGAVLTAPLTLTVLDDGLTLLTPSPLPVATDGEPYEAFIDAGGGIPPYFFGVSDGALPAGLTIGLNGVLSGTPSGGGSYDFELKVFDNGLPPATVSKAYTLPVAVGPLEIVGFADVDLLIAKLIVLPLIFAVDGFAIPYVTQLQAKGGTQPYTWTLTELAEPLQALIPASGLPDGLSLSPDGTLSGSVTDPSLAIDLEVPFTGLTLSGFFFSARCTDDQPVPFAEAGLYIIPTVPIGGE